MVEELPGSTQRLQQFGPARGPQAPTCRSSRIDQSARPGQSAASARFNATTNALNNGQIPPYYLPALIVLLVLIGRLDPDTLNTLTAVTGIIAISKDLLKPKGDQ